MGLTSICPIVPANLHVFAYFAANPFRRCTVAELQKTEFCLDFDSLINFFSFFGNNNNNNK